MPFTPLHFGPGAAFHAASPKHVSFLMFCASNVIVDVEPLYYMVSDQYPIHRFFHTYVGVTLVIGFTVLITIMLRKVRFIPNYVDWKTLTVGQIITGAALGGYSHIVLDSVMHTDIRPFAPFSDANTLLHLVSLDTLHLICIGAGILGLIVLSVRRMPSSGSEQN